MEDSWQSTACILCSINCGIEVAVEEGRLASIRGHREHPASQGYLCQKATRLDHYQNHARRLRQPLRRRPDGGFEPIDWDTAIREVAEKLVAVRDRHGEPPQSGIPHLPGQGFQLGGRLFVRRLAFR